MRRPCRRMRPAVEVDDAIHRTPPLDVIRRKIARDRIDFLLKTRAANSAPLVCRRMWPALVFRNAPNGFGRRLGPLAPCSVQRQTHVFAKGRLTTVGQAVFMILDRPFSGKINLSKCW